MTLDKPSPPPIVFKIDASRCELRIGDPVTPVTPIGQDWDTGNLIQAGCRGQVESIHFNAADHALIVVIEAEPHPPSDQDEDS